MIAAGAAYIQENTLTVKSFMDRGAAFGFQPVRNGVAENNAYIALDAVRSPSTSVVNQCQ